MSFKRVGTMSDVWSGEKIGVEVGGRPVLLVNVDGVVCAYEDRCRHKGVRLSAGKLDGVVLTCSAHGWTYDARTGFGINPEGVKLTPYPVRIEDDEIMVDVPDREGGDVERGDEMRDWVGPVLQKGQTGDAVVAAIAEENQGARLVDRGAYVRVLCHRRCRVTRAAIERRTGAPFRLPADLELVMSSFKGRFEVSEDEAAWETAS
jgi:toluene monooxygenase system ferredoxin subunit